MAQGRGSRGGQRHHQRHDQRLERDGAARRPERLELEQPYGRALGDGGEAAGERRLVLGVPAIEEVLSPELRAEDLAKPGPRQAEPVGARIQALEDEGIGQDPGNPGGLDLEPARRGPG